MGAPEDSTGGLLSGMMRAGSALAGVHIEHAQREASNDLGRLTAGLVLIVASGLFAACALLVAHGAAVWALREYTILGWLYSLLAVLGGDLLLALLLLLGGRAKLRRPILKDTRQLLRRTVKSLGR